MHPSTITTQDSLENRTSTSFKNVCLDAERKQIHACSDRCIAMTSTSDGSSTNLASINSIQTPAFHSFSKNHFSSFGVKLNKQSTLPSINSSSLGDDDECPRTPSPIPLAPKPSQPTSVNFSYLSIPQPSSVNLSTEYIREHNKKTRQTPAKLIQIRIRDKGQGPNLKMTEFERLFSCKNDRPSGLAVPQQRSPNRENTTPSKH